MPSARVDAARVHSAVSSGSPALDAAADLPLAPGDGGGQLALLSLAITLLSELGAGRVDDQFFALVPVALGNVVRLAVPLQL